MGVCARVGEQAMEEVGLPVDMIGGTSQGAFIAAAYAQSLSAARMAPAVRALCDSLGSTWGLLQDLTLPVFSLLSGRGFSATLRRCLGGGDIRDAWVPFFCVSTCVSSPYTGEALRVHRRGPAWFYVRASMTLVGYLPPLYDAGELLVDGGVCSHPLFLPSSLSLLPLFCSD